jgi:hypothetical protein
MREYIDRHTRQLELLEAMWADPLVQCYNDNAKPSVGGERKLGSVFLAGPTSRHQILECGWRGQAVAYLREAGFKGYIYVPEPRGQEVASDFTERGYIHNWESSRLLHATNAVFWIPRKADELLGLNTNFEFGIFVGKMLSHSIHSSIFFGWPPEAERMGLPNHYAVELAGGTRFTTLHGLCYAAAGKFEVGVTV